MSASMYQQTITKPVRCSGSGLHTGLPVNMVLKPAPENSGIQFFRKDLGNQPIPALNANLSDTRYATSLASGGVEVRTVEHLMSALYGLEIDNLQVELNGPEVPILDGSAAPFVRLLTQAGVVPQRSLRRYLAVRRKVEVVDGDRKIQVFPSSGLRVSYAIDFQHPLIPYQEISMSITPERYLGEIASARTFCRLEDVKRLRALGLVRGGSLQNAVVVTQNRFLNGNLRYRNEFVRHKILDLLGDLGLAGHRLLGHIVAFRAGHELHTRFLTALLSDPDAWELVTRPFPASENEAGALEPAVAAGSPS